MEKSNYLKVLSIVITSLLLLLWSYTAFSKLADLKDFKHQLYNQSFSSGFAAILLWAIPAIEITAILLLCFLKTRFQGLLLSSLLMFLFTGYIGLVLSGYYERIPCSCGGVIRNLSWKAHLCFNIFFLVIALTGTYIQFNFLNHRKEDATK